MYFHILVPIDGSATSERGLGEAVRLAAALRSALVLLHIVEDVPARFATASMADDGTRHRAMCDAGRTLLERAARAAAEAGVPAETVQREASRTPVADVILDEAAARECGLIVMGTHGRRGRTPLALGGDAQRVVEATTMPVLLVRESAGG